MTNRNKNILLISGFIIALIISYKFTISKTVDAKRQVNTLIKQEVLYKDAPRMLLSLKQKQKYYDSILAAHKLDGSSLQNNLLKTITVFADSNGIKITHFLEPHIISKNDLQMKTYDFSLQGDYNNILKLIHQLEQQTKFGEIINLHFEKKKDYRSGTNFLQARVLLRSFGS